jgi:uncharacterized protein YigA (DUF484 family)
MSDAAKALGERDEAARDIRDFLRAHPEVLRGDEALLSELGLRLDAANLVDFGPAAIAKASAAHKREASVRKQLEALAKANFAAQAQTHAAVIDLLEARNHSDLARRVDELATLRLGLAGAVVALEGPARTPAGWVALVEGQVDLVLGPQKVARMGFHAPALPLFGDRAGSVKSMALVRLGIWAPTRQGILAFGSPDASGFTSDMGSELVAFLARVFERTAERWPIL